ncbi:hypothetical protein [Clostridium oryzae]|uniref:Uncharacterized protein n=1 Tax=Clostridium oryzae TaxID=1450648 RepID=A0A1V4IMG1_9CLOT|nr:hypothetical protein [Clostridium oryzae]OPJ60677.1 hypothetical protein CLORY_27280 [Clostridium oryzae]
MDNEIYQNVREQPKEDYYIYNGGKKILAWNGYYKCFTAEYCRHIGLPMLNKENYSEYADKWLSKSRRKKIGKPVKEDEVPVAFYRINNRYCALYDRI